MSDWSTTTIGESCTTFSGGTPSTSRPEYYGGDIPWITSGDLNQGRIRGVNGRITPIGLERSSAKLIKAGTPLLALYGATAGVAAMPLIDGAINQAVLALIPRRSDKEFLYQWLSINRESIIGKYTQGGQPNLSGAVVRSIEIPLPPLREQQRIAEALRDADDLIATLERLITKKQAIKQGLMQQLLTGKTRLPGFEGSWTEATWGELAETISSGATPRRSRSDYWGGDIPWVTSTELNRDVIRKVPQTITEDGLRAANLTVWPVGTFLMAITGLEAAGTRGNCGILGVQAAANQSCMAVVPNKRLDSAFLYHYYLLRGDELAFRFTQGTKQQSYTAAIVKTLPIRVPDCGEQRAISAVIGDAGAEIAALHAHLDKARNMKVGMMQELLTGRTRLPDGDGGVV